MDRIFIDVREPEEFIVGHVKNAVNIPLGDIAHIDHYIDKITKDTELIVYCRSGNRSNTAKIFLEQMGYSNVVNGINQQHIQTTYAM